MRIGQLARRLGVPPTEILAFLGTQNIDAESGTNSRLSEDVVRKVIGNFAPEKLSEILQAPAEEPAPEVNEVVEQQPEPQPVAEEPQTEIAEPAPDAPVEVIRVAKVELQGLKVLGKIDLPAPKKKTETTAEEQQQSEEQQQQPQAQPPRREFRDLKKRNDRRDREWKNPIEQKREQEAREAERKKKENAERLKEKRTNHYYSKVKSVPTKAVRRIEEQTVVEDIEIKEPPKGLIGKFLRWLRT